MQPTSLKTSSNSNLSTKRKRSDSVVLDAEQETQQDGNDEAKEEKQLSPTNDLLESKYSPSKRQTIPDTGHGVNYQIHQSMYWGFYHTYNTPGTSFELRTEDTTYGDFDDLVVITQEHVIVYQYKHRKHEGTYSLSDFLTKSGNGKELMLFKYFDSVRKKLQAELAPEEKDEETFCFVSNQKLPDELESHMGADRKFKKNFYTSNKPSILVLRSIITASILKHSEHADFPTTKPTISELAQFLQNFLSMRTGMKKYISNTFKKKLFKFIKERGLEGEKFSEDEKNKIIISFLKDIINEKIILDKAERKRFLAILQESKVATLSLYEMAAAGDLQQFKDIELFLKKLQFQFGAPCVQQLTEDLQRDFRQRFNTTNDSIYHACFHEFYDWLISPTAVVLNQIQVKGLFDGWFNQFIYLERLCGLTHVHLGRIQGKTHDGHAFARKDEVDRLRTAMNSSDDNNIILLQGEAGIGKSSVVKELYSELKPKDGEFLFADLRDMLLVTQKKSKQPDAPTMSLSQSPLFTIKHLRHVKWIFIDNAELMAPIKAFQDFVLQVIAELRKTKQPIKLILLLRVEFTAKIKEIINANVHPTSSAENQAEEKQEQKINYPCISLQPLSLDAVVKQYPDLRSIKDLKIKKITHILRIPFYLNIIIRRKSTIQQEIRHWQGQKVNLGQYIIRLMIEKPVQPKAGIDKDANRAAEQRKSTMRALIYANSKLNGVETLPALRQCGPHVIDGLIEDGILIGNNELGYEFSHALYEQWAASNATQQEIQRMVEMEDEIAHFFAELQKRLARYQHVWTWVIKFNVALTNYIYRIYRADVLENIKNNYHHLLYISVKTQNKELFDWIISFVNFLNIILVEDDDKPITFLGAAIACPDDLFMRSLLSRGAKVSLKEYVNTADFDNFNSHEEMDEFSVRHVKHDWYPEGEEPEVVHEDDDYDSDDLTNDFYENDNNNYIEESNRPYKYCIRDQKTENNIEELATDYHGNTHYVDPVPQDARSVTWDSLFHVNIALELGFIDRANLLVSHLPKDIFIMGGENLLHVAITFASTYFSTAAQMIGLLLKHGYSTKSQDENGETPLHNAVYALYPDQINYSLQIHIFNLVVNACRNTPTINTVNQLGWTALHLAVLVRNQFAIDCLVDAKASPEITDKKGDTPADLVNRINASIKGESAGDDSDENDSDKERSDEDSDDEKPIKEKSENPKLLYIRKPLPGTQRSIMDFFGPPTVIRRTKPDNRVATNAAAYFQPAKRTREENQTDLLSKKARPRNSRQ